MTCLIGGFFSSKRAIVDAAVVGVDTLECKTLRDGSVRITCDVTGDSAVYGMEM